MTASPLFHRAAVPLDREAHRTGHRPNPKRFGFARDSHIVPVVVDEFGPAPIFLTGLVPGRCTLIDADGAWHGRSRACCKPMGTRFEQ